MQPVTCDVLVVGTGAAGFAAAITASIEGLDVIMVEKEAVFGGTTAFSAGVLWIPANSHARQTGVNDSAALALDYLREQAGNRFDETMARAFLENGPEMVDFFEANTQAKSTPITWPDYKPALRGGLPNGRSLRPLDYDGRRLGNWFATLRPPIKTMAPFGGMMIGAGDLFHLYNALRSPGSLVYAARLLGSHAIQRLNHPRGTRLTGGNALIARLAASALERNIPLWLRSPVMSLAIADGNVVGAVVKRGGQPIELRSRYGVVLATGGFPGNDAMRRPFDRKNGDGLYYRSLAPATNTGDGILLAESVGGVLDDNIHHHVAWTPVSLVPQSNGSTIPFPGSTERGKPGFIVVNRQGRRFANETLSYHDFTQAMNNACREGDVIEAFIIGDHRSVRRFGLGVAAPFPMPVEPHIRNGYLKRGGTVAELARAAGIDEQELLRSVATFNVHAAEGRDPEFGRGSDAYQTFMGVADLAARHPNIAPIDTGPFYALRIIPGDIGTFVGLRTNDKAQVLDSGGAVISGLYAVGNDMASVMRGTYPGAGITIGPAMTFGFIAARHLAQKRKIPAEPS
jgi:succinate dehydrogenase/fumarate reductase flavoprotein subunit